MLKLYENIKKLRKENGWSQEELAKRTGYTDRSTIAKIESGKVDLSQSKIMEFAKVFGVDPGDLMGWEDESIDPYYNSEEYLNSITDDEKYLIETYRDLTPDSKEKVTEYAEFLMVKENKQENTPVLNINPPRSNAFAARKLPKSSSKLLRRRKNGAG